MASDATRATHAQGFLLSNPLAADGLDALLRSRV
jgi:EAL domain-containing protein (putative c-di-GMP-specific phosphodiesterase class I)